MEKNKSGTTQPRTRTVGDIVFPFLLIRKEKVDFTSKVDNRYGHLQTEIMRELGDFLVFYCDLIFVCRFAANFCAVVAATVKVGPTVAMGFGRQLNDTHRQLYLTSVKQHLSTSVSVESNPTEIAPKENTSSPQG